MRLRTLALILVVLSLSVIALAADIALEVKVSPNVLVLKAPTNWITIHTDMPLSAVDQSSLDVAVNGNSVPIALVKADACGQMVLKISQAEVDPYVDPPWATFVVTGATNAGDTFEGADTIRVRD